MSKFTKACRSLVDKLGKTIEITNPGTSTYNPTTGQTSLTGSTTAQIKAAISSANQAKINAEVEMGDLIALIKANDFTPDINSEVTINGNKYKALVVEELYAYEQIALYQLQLRRIS